jgi:hypothetical protein
MESSHPEADAAFSKIFGEGILYVLSQCSASGYSGKTSVWNPVQKIKSQFQNW